VKLSIVAGTTKNSIEILERPPACRFRIDDGPEKSADVALVEPSVYSILINGRSYEARVEEGPGGLVVLVEGFRFELEVRDPRRFSRRSAGGQTEGVQNISAPMPGKVVRVLVAPGDEVFAGQGLVVVEAMKMQNEMKAARAGIVLSVSARPGSTVTAGEVLATIS